MLQKTHSVAGFVAAEIVLVHQHVPWLSWQAAGALLLGCAAGILADVDKQGSTIAKVLFPLSALLRILKVRHRTVTHSLLFILALMAAAASLPALFFRVFIIAYASHPLIDLLNEKGVQLLWPLPVKVRFLPHCIAIDTGSASEKVFRLALFAVSLWIPFSTIEFQM
jgi:inner membrane protein